MGCARDEDGMPIKDGDYITFSFGIPPVSVFAQIVTVGDDLWIHCLHPENVKPKREKLSRLQKWYPIWRASRQRIAAHRMEFRKDA